MRRMFRVQSSCQALQKKFRGTGPSVFRKQHMSEREPFPATLTILGRRKGCLSTVPQAVLEKAQTGLRAVGPTTVDSHH